MWSYVFFLIKISECVKCLYVHNAPAVSNSKPVKIFNLSIWILAHMYLKTGRFGIFHNFLWCNAYWSFKRSCNFICTHQQLLFKFKAKSTKRKNKENSYSTKLNMNALACGRICRHLSVGGAALSKTIFTLFTLCAQSF